MSFLRARAFWATAFEWLVIPVAALAVFATLIVCMLAVIIQVTS